MQANTEALRSFIHGDIQPIIESHVETTLLDRNIIKKRRVDGVDDSSNHNSNNNSSTHTSVYVPPINVAVQPARTSDAAPAQSPVQPQPIVQLQSPP